MSKKWGADNNQAEASEQIPNTPSGPSGISSGTVGGGLDELGVDVEAAKVDIAAAEADIATLDGRVDTAETDIAAAQADITALESWRGGFCYAELGDPAAEVANVRTVAVQMKDWDGQNFAQAMLCRAYMLLAAGAPADATQFTIAETGDGTPGTAAGPHITFTTSAGGVAQLSITDVAGASSLTPLLVVDVLNGGGPAGRPQLKAIPFDGA
jgi:hypothetical protein